MSQHSQPAWVPDDLQKPAFDQAEWDKRKRDNKRLGYVFGVLVVLIFLGSIWKYRPF